MKFLVILLVLAISALYAVQTEQAFAEQAITCQPRMVCVHPGDMLKYSITLNSANSSQTFNFGDMLDSNHIMVEQDQVIGNNIQNNTMVLNLKTGFEHNKQDPRITNPFLEVLALPIDYNKTDSSIAQVVTDFNGFKRIAIVALHNSGNSTSKMEYDMETGILLDEQSTSLVAIGNRLELVNISNTLTNTNVINSDSPSIQTMRNTISIPGWVKNNAKYWNEGSIDDSTFAQGIQYMIKQGAITIPSIQSNQTSSGVTIPKWVKQNAGFWADEQISDEDFVKSIQWLITNGIIQV